MAKRLIVIGGVAAGTSAASRARRFDENLEIILFEAGPYISYGACDEPYFIAGVVPKWENLLVRPPDVFRKKQNIDVRLHHEVTAIDPMKKEVTVHNITEDRIEQYTYDTLILATGARPRRLDIPGADAPNVFHIKSLESAIALDEFIRAKKPQRAVSIGAGFIVLELAEALHARGVANVILHRSDKPGKVVEAELSAHIRAELEKQGVGYVPNTAPKRFILDDRGLVTAVATDNETYPADLIIAGLGVVPNVEIGTAAGVLIGPSGAFAVDDHMRTNVPDIYAAGDCTETINRVSGLPHLYPLGDIANKHGWTAGENAAGGDIVYPGAIGSMHFKCFDLEVGATGIGEDEARRAGFDVFTNVVTHRSRAHAQPASKPIHVKLVVDKKSRRLLGAQIVGAEGAALRTNVLAMAVHAGLTVDQLADADLAYAPPFSPVIDPVLIAGRDAVKKLG
ncbi:MAG TPA: FAD-dependent oxidoreductase [bacterium]|nr:FAD-dependent oxidoreductase [bacterium]